MKANVGDNQLPPRDPRRRSGDSHRSLSDGTVFVFFVVLAVACVGGYFLLMKLINISKQEDCFLAGRHNCGAAIEIPSR